MRSVFLVAFLSFMVSGCDFGLSMGEDNGPPIIREEMPIRSDQIQKVSNISKSFSKQNGLKLTSGVGPHGFTVYMEKGNLGIAAHNTVHSDIVYIGAWDKGQNYAAHKALATRYVVEIRRAIGHHPPDTPRS